MRPAGRHTDGGHAPVQFGAGAAQVPQDGPDGGGAHRAVRAALRAGVSAHGLHPGRGRAGHFPLAGVLDTRGPHRGNFWPADRRGSGAAGSGGARAAAQRADWPAGGGAGDAARDDRLRQCAAGRQPHAQLCADRELPRIAAEGALPAGVRFLRVRSGGGRRQRASRQARSALSQ